MVNITWVIGHTDVEGNKEAYELADAVEAISIGDLRPFKWYLMHSTTEKYLKSCNSYQFILLYIYYKIF